MKSIARENEKDYVVGYCKPPLDTKFKKGQSGNPGGRPKGSGSVTSSLRAHLTREEADAIARKLIELAKQGDLRAMDIIFNRIDGRVAEHTELGHSGRIYLIADLPGLKSDNAVQAG